MLSFLEIVTFEFEYVKLAFNEITLLLNIATTSLASSPITMTLPVSTLPTNAALFATTILAFAILVIDAPVFTFANALLTIKWLLFVTETTDLIEELTEIRSLGNKNVVNDVPFPVNTFDPAIFAVPDRTVFELEFAVPIFKKSMYEVNSTALSYESYLLFAVQSTLETTGCMSAACIFLAPTISRYN